MSQKLPHPKEMGMFANLRYDLPAGLVVFLVALPLCLGIALASGAPLFSGIITGTVGGIVVGSYSHSPLSVSGPAARLTVIVFSFISLPNVLEIIENFKETAKLKNIKPGLINIWRVSPVAAY
jgi:MFS superfamily sulfate permease-like transporter